MFSISVRYYILFSVIIVLLQTVSLNKNGNDRQMYSEKVSTKARVSKKSVTVSYPNTDMYSYEDYDIDEKELNLTDADRERLKIWPQGVIPYYIDTYSYKDKVVRDRIRDFLGRMNTITDFNFMELPSPPADSETRWVFFVNRRGLLGCADHSVTNFTNRGVQHVILGYDCLSTRNELAEAVLSIVGVPSQHNAPNRDDYIEVIIENIIPEKRYLFNKIPAKDWLFHDIGYDFKSASHFDSHKHSQNGKATIRIKEPKYVVENNDKHLSTGDIKKMKLLYKFASVKKILTVNVCQKLFGNESALRKLSVAYINNNQQFYSAGGYFSPINENIIIQDSYIIINNGDCKRKRCRRRKHKRKSSRRKKCKRRRCKRKRCSGTSDESSDF